MMGYETRKIALVREAVEDRQLRDVPSHTPSRCVMNGRNVGVDTIPTLIGRPFVPPTGWRGLLA